MEPEVERYDGDYIWGNLHEDALESLIYILIYIGRNWGGRVEAPQTLNDVFVIYTIIAQRP